MRLKSVALSTVIALLSACTSTQSSSGSGASSMPQTRSCNADLITVQGQTANDSSVQRAQQQAGAEKVRLILPDRMYTTDYDEQRLSIRLDDSNKILSAYCG